MSSNTPLLSGKSTGNAYTSNDGSCLKSQGSSSSIHKQLNTIKNSKSSKVPASSCKKVKHKDAKLGTFEGVFLPTSLNVLSILMFLRFGFIIGQMGIAGTFLLLIMSYTIDILTTLSISAISTNGTVKGGGAYYMISRSLGPEFGGAIGVIFFIGQILNLSLNVVGFIEPLMVNFGKLNGDMLPILPVLYMWQVLYSTVLLAICTGIALVGASLVSKTAFWLFIILTLSTLSIPVLSLFVRPFHPFPAPFDDLYYTGLSWSTFISNLWPNFTSGAAGSVQPPGVPETFKNLFGIFFPATAGIFAGASMSGDLKNPSQSIPNGTLKGLAITFVLYSLVIASMGSSIPRDLLHHDIKVIQTVSLHGIIIILGEFSTSLFSVIMGIVGAALMLSAIADDRIIPGLSIFTVGKKSEKEKKRAQTISIIATWFIAQIFLFADINQIATFITMAFLMTFIVTNLACFLLKLGSAPNFRPSFKYFSSKTAFMGATTSVLAMYIVDGLSASLVIVFLFFLIMMIHYLTPPLKFGDISQLLIYHQVRKYLLRLKLQMSVKYWRPQILLLCDDPRTSWNLIGFCNHLKKGGLYILGHVVIMGDDTEKGPVPGGNTFSSNAFKELQKQNQAWVKLRDMSKIKAFVQLALGPTLPWGVRNVYLGSGLGGMRPNITVIGFYDFLKHGVLLPTSRQLDELPTDFLRKERKVSINQWVQIIEDLIIMQATVAVAANFGGIDLPQNVHKPHFWSQPKMNSNGAKFIDLYPIQMSSVDTLEDGKSVLSTNFDTYTLILQLGAILTTVSEWKYSGYVLRVIVFVETEDEIVDEEKRLKDLLTTLRIQAETKIVCLSDGSLSSYNFMVRGYKVTSGNKTDFKNVDSCLQGEQWWSNLCNAREALREIEKQKAAKRSVAVKKSNDTSLSSSHRFDPLLLTSALPDNLGGSLSFNAKRRNTISGLHDKGISLSLNMRTQGGSFFPSETVESSESSDDEFEYDDTGSEGTNETDEISFGQGGYLEEIYSSRASKPTITSSHPPTSGATTPKHVISKYSTVDQLRKPKKGENELFRMNNNLTSDQISIRSSRSNLRPNFLSVKVPQAKVNDDDAGSDDDNIPSIRFVNEDEKDNNEDDDEDGGAEIENENEVTQEQNQDSTSVSSQEKHGNELFIDVKKREGSVDPLTRATASGASTPRRITKENKRQSSALFSNGDDIIQKLRTPKFSPNEDIEQERSMQPPSISLTPSGSGPQSVCTSPIMEAMGSRKNDEVTRIEGNDDATISQKQLQEELKLLTFNDIPAKGQHLILNELMRRNSPNNETGVIFSTLPAPNIGTHLDEAEAFEYTNNLAILLDNLPPVLLINSQTITVTTAL